MQKCKVCFSKDRIAEAKERRLAWRYGQITDQIPFCFLLQGAPQKYKVGERVSNIDKAIEDIAIYMNYQMSEFPDSDYIPYFPMDYLGEGLIPSMFGAKQFITENNFPFTEGRIIKDLEQDLPRLPRKIDPEKDGWGPILKNCVLKFLDTTDGEIPVGICDVQSPYGVATKLIGNEDLMLAMYDTPELVHELMNIVTSAIIDTVRAMEKWTDNSRLLVKNYVDPLPGGGIVLFDDYISVISPKLHEEFCLPYNKRIYQEFGRGHLHTCGPNFPNYLDEIFKNDPVSIDIIILRNMSKTREDMLMLKKLTRALGVNMNGNLTASNYHILNNDDRIPPDHDFVKQMAMDGGLLWVESGKKEDGLKYLEMAKNCI